MYWRKKGKTKGCLDCNLLHFVWLKLSIYLKRGNCSHAYVCWEKWTMGNLGGWAIRNTKTTDLIATPCLIMCDQTPPSHDTTVWPQQSSCCPSWLLLDFGNRWFHLNLSLKVGFERVGVGVLCSYTYGLKQHEEGKTRKKNYFMVKTRLQLAYPLHYMSWWY